MYENVENWIYQEFDHSGTLNTIFASSQGLNGGLQDTD